MELYVNCFSLRNVKQMLSCGLYINDLSLHDSTRAAVLAGSQQSNQLEQELQKVTNELLPQSNKNLLNKHEQLLFAWHDCGKERFNREFSISVMEKVKKEENVVTFIQLNCFSQLNQFSIFMYAFN